MQKFLRPFNVFLFLGLFLCGFFAATCQAAEEYHKRTELLLDTIVEITGDNEEAIQKAIEEIKRVENQLSYYLPDSEIGRLNQHGKARVSSETLALLKEAKEAARLSAGAFDVTAAPLIDLWKAFIRIEKEDAEKAQLPTPQQVQDALRLTGYEGLIINEEDSSVAFSKAGMRVDLGGIGKGYTVDCAVKVMRSLGVTSALINIGGHVYCLGEKGGRPWKIGIRDPKEKNKVFRRLLIKDRAVATSGNYEQGVSSRGKTYGHIIDPRTGYPVENNILSVTVLADTCTQADMLATAIFVLGEKDFSKLLVYFPDIEVIIITTEGVIEYPRDYL